MDQTDRILRLFAVNMNRYLHTQDIAQECGMDEQTVQNNIEALRNRGYEILQNEEGYCFTDRNDRMTEELIRLFAPDLPGPVYAFETIGSTNDYAKELARKGAPHGTVVVSDSQTAGRGRVGHRFHSPEKTGLYFSMIIRPDINPIDLKPAHIFRITPAAAIAAYEACAELTGIHCRIKWVNDLYIKDRKCAGILCESLSSGGFYQAVITGIGINWRTMEFPDELKDIACSFSCDTVCRAALAGMLAEKLLENTADLDKEWIMEMYRDRSAVLGKQVSYTRDGISYAGIAKEINDDGNLIIEKPDGTIDVLMSGEISVRFQET